MKKILFCVFALTASLSQAQSLTAIEGVEYDPTNQIFLVGNGNNVVRMHSDAVPQGTLGTAKSNYGMEVMNGVLFSIVGTAIRGYDVTTGAQVMTHTLSGASFLNGMASNGTDKLWVSDFSAKKIYELNVADLAAPTSSIVVANTTSTPNGLTYDAANNRLVMVSWGGNASIKAIDLATYTLSVITTTNLGNCDGVDHDSYGNYYVSSWSPNAITKFSNDFTTTSTVTVTGGVSSAADICYAEEIDTLAIPCTGNNVVKFVGFNPSFVVEGNTSEFQAYGYPTEVKDMYTVGFDLPQAVDVNIRLFDVNGRLVNEVIHQTFPQGNHQVVLTELPVDSGIYFVQVWAGTHLSVVSFIR
ncbi:MAG: hypothetical protein RLZZ91_137 [Bacteroidota bacterium]|jgi:hypothetical protein